MIIKSLNTLILPQLDALFLFTYQMKCNKQLKYSNYVAYSHFHGTAVNNSGLFSSNKSNSMAETFISEDEVQKEKALIDKYKVIIGKVVPRGGEVGVDPKIGYRVISTIQILRPKSVFTDSYLLLAYFDTEIEAVNFAKYMCCKLPRFLLHETYSSMNISKNNFRFVPYLNYDLEWTDEMLFERYNCSNDEKDLINSIIRPMEYVIN